MMTRFAPLHQPRPRVPARRPSRRLPNAERVPHSFPVEPETGPLSVLADHRVLLLADIENLELGARDLGTRISYRRLAATLHRHARECTLHAFFSRDPGDTRKTSYLRARGWVPHPRDIETVRTHRGLEREANSDNVMLFMAGVLSSRGKADIVVLASGDGKLVSDLATVLVSLPKRRTVVTMSLAGSTAWRLNAATHDHIDANIEIGLDCMHTRPSTPGRRTHPVPR